MPLTDDMRRLCDRCTHDYDSRINAVHAIRDSAVRTMNDAVRTMADLGEAHRRKASEVHRHISELGAARSRIGKQQSRDLTQFHIDLHNSVSEFVVGLQGAHMEMASEIGRRIHDLGAAREKAGDQQEQFLEEFHSDLCRDVNEFISDVGEAHANRAAEIRSRIHDFGAARNKTGAELRHDLEEFYQTLCHDVDEFIGDLEEAHRNRASEISQRMHDLGAARDEMSAEQRQRLTEEHARLETTVNQTRSELRADLKQAREVWGEFTSQMRQKEISEAETRPQAEPEPAAKPAHGESPSTAAAADDLTVISGIGPGRQQRLNEMGIHTFAQLAHTSAEDLRNGLGQSSHLVDVTKWVEAAKKRA